MKRIVARILTAAIVASMAMSVAAQQKPSPKPSPSPASSPRPAPKPSFSGKWTVVSPKDNAGRVQIVTQDTRTLTTEQAADGGSRKMTYQLDGVERRLALSGQGAADITMMARAVWEADHIVIFASVSYSNGMKTQSKEVWSIDAQGRLVIDYSENGPTGPGPSVRVIHVKKQ